MVTKDKWASLIKDFYESELPESFEREIEIPLEKPINRSVSIIGPRRAGKTYLMFNLIKKLLSKGVSKKEVLYMNFEKAGLLPLESNDLVSMKETFYELNPRLKKKETWFFLDEIQNVSGWEIFVRTCLDEGINVFISGSSSKMLSKDISTSMRGRTLTYYVFPFSFRECLLFKGIKLKKYFSSSEKSKIINLFKRYLYDGGYPEQIIYNKEKEKILSNIYETTLFKDVIERENIRNIPVIKQLIKALINSKEFSVNKFFNYLKSLNLKVSKNSLYNYVSYLEDAFFVFLLKKFDLSYRKAEQSLPKVYFIDNGILDINGIDDKGRLLENLIFLELIRRGKEISYYQNVLHEEVDFVLKKGKKVKELIQVCYDFENFATKERELKILVKASEEFSCDNLILISMDKEGEEKYKNKKIKFVPAWKWCLEEEK
ncbi:MAG: ATP-binding protein [Nanoarchaeota archaeon]|nr:ATP-binding protein [Nanoarchaeota archaeon]